MSEETIAQAWERIDTWLRENAPNVFATLKPGASEAELQALQAALGVTLPPDMLASYRIHNGADNHRVWTGVAGYDQFLDLDSIKREWMRATDWIDNDFEDEIDWMVTSAKFDKRIAEKITNSRRSARRIPVAWDGKLHYLCIDLVPSGKGTAGQIIWAGWGDSDDRPIIALNFAELLGQWADAMEGGEHPIRAGLPIAVNKRTNNSG